MKTKLTYQEFYKIVQNWYSKEHPNSSKPRPHVIESFYNLYLEGKDFKFLPKDDALFNFEGLTPIELGRLKKTLDKQFRFSEGVFTLRQYIEKFAIGKRVSKGGIFNRRYFNSLDYEAQQKYEENLSKKVEYEIILKDDTYITIPKIVYNNLNL